MWPASSSTPSNYRQPPVYFHLLSILLLKLAHPQPLLIQSPLLHFSGCFLPSITVWSQSAGLAMKRHVSQESPKRLWEKCLDWPHTGHVQFSSMQQTLSPRPQCRAEEDTSGTGPLTSGAYDPVLERGQGSSKHSVINGRTWPPSPVWWFQGW